MIRKIGFSLIIQTFGTLSSLFLVWLITNKHGIELQGQFVLIKSWIDLAVVAACFGLPQSFIYGVNQLNISLEQLEKFTLRYIFFICFICFIATYTWFEYIQKQEFLNIWSYFFIAVSVSCLTGYNLMRGLFLTINDGNKFAYVTIAPAITLFLIFVIYSFFYRDNINFPLIYIFSTLLAFVFVAINLKKNEKKTDSLIFRRIPWSKLVDNGFSVFIQSLASTLLPLGIYWLMSTYGFSKGEVGLFSIALYIYILFTLPLNMVAPLFFNKWSRVSDIDLIKKELFKFFKISFFLIPVVLVCYWFLPKILPAIFGDQIGGVIMPTKILLSAIIALYLNNLLTCFLMSQGYFRSISIIYVLKTLSCLCIVGLLMFFEYKTLNSIAFSLVVVEYIILLIFCFISWRKCATIQ